MNVSNNHHDSNGDSKEVHKDGDDKTSTADTAAGVAGGFVFGSNLADRVVNGQTGEERKEGLHRLPPPFFIYNPNCFKIKNIQSILTFLKFKL